MLLINTISKVVTCDITFFMLYMFYKILRFCIFIIKNYLIQEQSINYTALKWCYKNIKYFILKSIKKKKKKWLVQLSKKNYNNKMYDINQSEISNMRY